MKNRDLPASPQSSEEFSDRVIEGLELCSGLTKREAFIMAAMQGLLAGAAGKELPPPELAHLAESFADAQLERLEQTS